MMKKALLLLMILIYLCSCQKNSGDVMDLAPVMIDCSYQTEIVSPPGYSLESIGTLEFNGGMDALQMLDQQVGYALAGNNRGGYVGMLKTSDGGRTWTDLELDIPFRPKAMLFRDADYGLFSVLDRTGCSFTDCKPLTATYRTQDGGATWKRIDYLKYHGTIFHLQYDQNGILYANLISEGRSIILRSHNDGNWWETFFDTAESSLSQAYHGFQVFQDKIFLWAGDARILVINRDGKLEKLMDTGDIKEIRTLNIIDEETLVASARSGMYRSTDAGDSWVEIHGRGAAIIGFESADTGLILRTESVCPTDTGPSNDLIAVTENGGVDWQPATATTSNLKLKVVQSLQIQEGSYWLLLRNELLVLRKN